MMKFMKNLRYHLLKAAIPVQKCLQVIHPPEPQTKMEEVLEALKKMESGDALLSSEKWHFTNLFIPGFWGHCACFYWSEKGEPRVIEAVGTGVQDVHFFDWVLRKHYWAVVRPTCSTVENRGLAVKFWKEQLKKPYDYLFSTTNEGWYCSELWYWGWSIACQFWTDNVFVLRECFGEKTIVPEDIYQAAVVDKKLILIHEHRDK